MTRLQNALLRATILQAKFSRPMSDCSSLKVSYLTERKDLVTCSSLSYLFDGNAIVIVVVSKRKTSFVVGPTVMSAAIGAPKSLPMCPECFHRLKKKIFVVPQRKKFVKIIQIKLSLSVVP